MSHSPGPWKVEPYTDLTTRDGERIRAADGLLILNEVWGNSLETCDANARLIAAAPELLALAKHILALETDPYLQGHPEWEAYLNEAQAAVWKAEGAYPCLKCGNRFRSVADMDAHQITAHGGNWKTGR